MRAEIWIKHDARSRVDPKMAYFLKCEGMQGYGIFWALIEILHYQNDHEFDINFELKGIAHQIGIDEKTLERVIDLLVECGLFKRESNAVYQERLKQNEAQRSTTKQVLLLQKRASARLGGLKSGEVRKNQKLKQNQEDRSTNEASASKHEANELDKKRIDKKRIDKKEIGNSFFMHSKGDPRGSNELELQKKNIPQNSTSDFPPGFREGAETQGEYKHVFLKPEELSELKNKFGESVVQSKIIHLDCKIENQNEKYLSYKNHASIIRSWCVKDSDETNKKNKIAGYEDLPEGWTWVKKDFVRGPDGKIYSHSFMLNSMELLKEN